MKALKRLPARFTDACIKLELFLHRHITTVMVMLGIGLLLGGFSELLHAQEDWHRADYNDTFVRNAIGNLFGLIEGSFGALIMVVAGLGAIVAAAMGAYRGAIAMLVVAIGAFILRALVSLFFGENFISMNGDPEAGQ